jgi:hypothetical protein
MGRAACVLLSLVLFVLLGPKAPPPRDTGVHRLIVRDAVVLHTIDYPFWGVNYVAFWDPIQGSTASRQALKNAGVELIRFPGGEPANWLNWAKPDTEPYWTTTSTDELWRYARGVGAQLLLQTNPTTNSVSDTKEANDPSGANAAGWVRYTRQRGIDAPYWEVGNEPDLRLGRDPDTLDAYFAAFAQQAAAMKRVHPGIKVFGPAGTNVYQWWRLGSLEQFLKRFGNRQGNGLADGVSLHYYPVGECLDKETAWEEVRNSVDEWPKTMEYIRRTIAAYDTRPLPVFISETNAAVGGMDCDFTINRTVASALANADLFGAYRETGVQAVQFFGAIHGSRGWGLLYGENDVRPADTPTPSYFILPIWTQAGDQVIDVTQTTAPMAELSSYAAKKADDSLQVILVNKTAAPMPVAISFSSFDPRGGVVRIYELKPEAGGVFDEDVIYNGARMPSVTGRALPQPQTERVESSEYSRTLPAYSLTLLDFGGNRSPPER